MRGCCTIGISAAMPRRELGVRSQETGVRSQESGDRRRALRERGAWRRWPQELGVGS
jgi:hypothetical protein